MQRLFSTTFLFVLLAALLAPLELAAGVHSGSVRAADHFIPGATVTARQGTVKLVTYTDENGQYSLILTPGHWDVTVEMLGFIPQTFRISGAEDSIRNWALEMPRFGEPMPVTTTSAPPLPPDAPASGPPSGTTPAASVPATAGATTPPATSAAETPAKPVDGTKTAAVQQAPSGQGRNRNGRGGQGQNRPGFQNASVKATDEGQQALAQAAAAPGLDAPAGDAEETMMVQGSTSGGLAASSDDESRRQRFMSRGGGPGGDNPSLFASGMGGPDGGMGLPPGMSNGSGDSLGLSGFGASAIAGGFGADSGPMPGMDRGGRGGPGGGGGRGGPGGSGGRGGRGPGGRGNDRRGPYNGQYSSFGNRHRTGAELTGSMFLTLNNSALNAAPFSLNGKTAVKPSYDQARFGLNIGGPLIIPKLLNLPRWSFYFTYSGTQSRNPYSALSSVPTPDERAGNFSGIANTIFDPLSGAPFAGNIIPTTRIDPIAQGLINRNFFPNPTYTGVVQNYRIVNSIPSNNGNYGVRLNAPLSTKDRLTFNVQIQGRDSQSEQLFGYHDNSTGSGLSASVGWSHSFAPRFNNSATISLSRNTSKNAPFFAYTENIAAELGIMGTAQDPINYGPPTLSFTNFGSLSDGTASVNRSQSISFTDGITYVIRRRHNLTFGYSFRKMQNNSLAYPNGRGSFSFSGLLTSQLNANGQPFAGTGFDFADFLLGLPQSSSVRYGSVNSGGILTTASNNYFRGWATSGYAQDDWRVSRRLSLNIGLRYEYFSPYTELYGHLANLDVNSSFTQAAIVTPGMNGPYSGNLPSSLVRPDDKAFSPRFGYAYRVAKKRGTVIRGGYSIFYSGSAYNQIASQMAAQQPFARSVTVTTSTANPLTLANGFTLPATQNISDTFAIDPNYQLAYAQQWVTAIQDTFHRDLVVEVEYIGTKGTHLGVVDQPNRAQPGASLLNAQTLLPIPYASAFNYQTSGANSSFNAGQVRLTRRFNRGMSFVGLYTFSKSIDDASSFSGPGGTTVQFIDNLHLERALSGFDQRHKLSATFILSSPVGVHGMLRNGGWKTTALTGWTLYGTYSIATGTPLTARVAGNLSNTGGTAAFGTGRAEATGLAIDAGNYPYFNLAAFTTPFAGTYGNAGRDTIPGPIIPTFNLSLNRSFRIRESRKQIQLRLSANNAFNHVVITGFGTTINSTTYGLATAASSTRTASLLLRFNF